MKRRVGVATLGALVLTLVWLALSSREAEPPPRPTEPSGTAVTGTLVEWRMALDATGTESVPVGAAVDSSTSWRTTTDLGYEVLVNRGWLVTFRAELVECPEEEGHEHGMLAPQVPDRQRLSSEWRRLERTPSGVRRADRLTTKSAWRTAFGRDAWPTAPPALAGHGSEPGETRSREVFVERLTPALDDEGEPTVLDTVRATGGPYCQAHYLLGPATETITGPDKEVDMNGVSLLIEGEYRVPDGPQARPFTLRSEEALGAILSLCGEEGDCSSAPRRLEVGPVIVGVTLSRDLGRLFDGIDLATAEDSEAARAVLRNAAENARAILSAPESHTSIDSDQRGG